MKTFVLVLALAAAVLSGSPVSSGYAQPAGGEISFQLFYDSLSPYGNWVYTEDYGYCWNPSVEEGWRPYTDGSWAYTDGGWTWSSNEPWGWATYHYGRWVETSDSGWLWVPGTEWAPAWVSWRTGDEYVGWAPLPPEAEWRPSYGFGTGIDVAFNIPPAYYNFCPTASFCAPYVRPHCLPRGRNIGIFNNTVNVTNIAVTNVNNNTVIFNKGPDYDRVSRLSKYPVQHARLERWNDLDQERVRGGYAWNRMEKGVYRAYSPRVSRRGENERPARISAEFRGDQLRRAWRSSEWKGRGENGRTASPEVAERTSRNRDSEAPWKRSAAAIEQQRAAARQAQRERQPEEQARRQQNGNTRWSEIQDVDERRSAAARSQAAAQRAAAGRKQDSSTRAERSRESAATAAWRRDQNARNAQRQEEAFDQQRQEEARRNAARRNAQSGEDQRQATQRNIQRQQVAAREREAAESRRQQQADQVRRNAGAQSQQQNAWQKQQRQPREQAAVQQRQQQQRETWQKQQRQNQQREESQGNRQQQQRQAPQANNWQRQQQQRQAAQASLQRQQQSQKQAVQQGQQQRRQQGNKDKKKEKDEE